MSYLEDIERSIFVLSLDKTIPVISSTDQETIHLNQTNHGGGSQMNSGNRWFDKIFQVGKGFVDRTCSSICIHLEFLTNIF